LISSNLNGEREKRSVRNLQQSPVAASSTVLSLTAAQVKTPRKWLSLEGAGQHEECGAAAKTNQLAELRTMTSGLDHLCCSGWPAPAATHSHFLEIKKSRVLFFTFLI